MKIALIGHGAMGHLVGAEATAVGDEVGIVLRSSDKSNDAAVLIEKLKGHDVAIDFSVGDAVLRNVKLCLHAGVPLIEGTTGWKKDEPHVKELVASHRGALVYGANFSIGINVFYRIVEFAASLFGPIPDYAPFIEEAHHSRKRDAPSGTAIRLGELMRHHYKGAIPTASTRAGFIPGTHRVGFDSVADQISLTHVARSRQGFASGALLAARWIRGRSGVYEFGAVIADLLDQVNQKTTMEGETHDN